jgi:hypothetical protein
VLKHSSNSHQEVIKQSAKSQQRVSKESSNSQCHQQSSNSHQIVVTQESRNSHQTAIKKSSNSHQTVKQSSNTSSNSRQTDCNFKTNTFDAMWAKNLVTKQFSKEPIRFARARKILVLFGKILNKRAILRKVSIQMGVLSEKKFQISFSPKSKCPPTQNLFSKIRFAVTINQRFQQKRNPPNGVLCS